jgi:maltose alpha-D-glucosyltransferase/alpha-amylase
VLAGHLVRAPWFAGKARLLTAIRVRDVILPATAKDGPEAPGVLALLRAEFLYGDPEDYSLWLGFAPEGEGEALPPQALMARARLRGIAGWLCEAQHLPAFRTFLVRLLVEGQGVAGVEVAHVGAGPPRLPDSFETRLIDSYPEEFRVLARGQVFLRWFRLLREGPRPDLEVVTALKRAFPKARAPAVLAQAMYRALPDAEPLVLGYAQRFVPAERSARDLARESLQGFLERIALAPEGRTPPPLDGMVPRRLDFHALPEAVQDALGGSWAEFASLLGRRLAELHLALARLKGPDFAPEPFSLLHLHSLYHAIRSRLRRALGHLARRPAAVPEALRPLAEEAVARQPEFLQSLRRLTSGRMEGRRLRIHGNLRLDRALFTGKDFVFTGFDGPQWLNPPERRLHFSPLVDVAAIIRDLHHVAGAEPPRVGPEPAGGDWAAYWAELSGGLFLDGYLEAAARGGFLPANPLEVDVLLEAFLMDRAVADVRGDPSRLESALRLLLRRGGRGG